MNKIRFLFVCWSCMKYRWKYDRWSFIAYISWGFYGHVKERTISMLFPRPFSIVIYHMCASVRMHECEHVSACVHACIHTMWHSLVWYMPLYLTVIAWMSIFDGGRNLKFTSWYLKSAIIHCWYTSENLSVFKIFMNTKSKHYFFC